MRSRRALALIVAAAAVVLQAPVARSALPASNGKIAFAGTSGIEVMLSDGSGRTTLTPRVVDAPTWSPDGSQIAYVHYGFGDRRSSLWIMNGDGSQRTLISRNPVGLPIILHPTWSPDGGRLAFCGLKFRPRLKASLFIVNADGTGLHDISRRTHIDCEPSWSPDGTQIAFDSYLGAFIRIAVMRIDGAHRHLLVPRGQDMFPSWSPDGTQLIFGRVPNGAVKQRQDLFIVNADGAGSLVRVTDTPRLSENAPVFSPDGVRIAFERASTSLGNPDIWVADADGTSASDLTNTKAGEFYPSWQRI